MRGCKEIRPALNKRLDADWRKAGRARTGGEPHVTPDTGRRGDSPAFPIVPRSPPATAGMSLAAARRNGWADLVRTGVTRT